MEVLTYMLTKIEKRIIDFCKSKNATNIAELAPLIDAYGHDDIYDAITLLDNKGLFSKCVFSDNGPLFFKLSYEARHQREYSWLKFKSFIANKIVTPLFVSILGSIITTLITVKLLGLL